MAGRRGPSDDVGAGQTPPRVAVAQAERPAPRRIDRAAPSASASLRAPLVVHHLPSDPFVPAIDARRRTATPPPPRLWPTSPSQGAAHRGRRRRRRSAPRRSAGRRAGERPKSSTSTCAASAVVRLSTTPMKTAARRSSPGRPWGPFAGAGYIVGARRAARLDVGLHLLQRVSQPMPRSPPVVVCVCPATPRGRGADPAPRRKRRRRRRRRETGSAAAPPKEGDAGSAGRYMPSRPRLKPLDPLGLLEAGPRRPR